MAVRKTILLIYCACSAAVNSFCQYKLDKAVRIGKENGLPANEVSVIRKSEDGFVWIGTKEGVCRFDGQRLKLYQTGDDLRHSLTDNFIGAILPVKNSIWIGTSQGISVLDSRADTFRHYQFEDGRKSPNVRKRFDQNVSAFCQDKSGTIWIGTAKMGVACYDEKKDDFRFFSFSREKYPRLQPALGSDNSILSVAGSANSDSVIWAGTPGGLWKIHKYTSEVRLYTFTNKDKNFQIALNAFRRLYHHDDGLLYVGSWAAGVNVFDPVAETFTPLPVRNELGKKLLNSPIGNITRKSDHEIWITSGLGLAVYDSRLKDVTLTKFNNPDNDEYYGLDMIDDANRIWCPTAKGALIFDPAIQQFTRNSFKHLSNVQWAYAFYILSDKTGNQITVCPRQTDGIYHFDKLKRDWTKAPFPNNESFRKEAEAIRSFVQLPSGEYLLVTDKGMFLYSEKKQQLSPLDKKSRFATLRRHEIILDDDGYVWTSNDEQELVKWKPGEKDYETFKVTVNPDSVLWLNHFYRDTRGNVWCQTGNGIAVFVAAKKSLVHFSHLINEKNTLIPALYFAEDRKGRVWVNGRDGSLGYALSADPEKGVVYKLNLKDRGIKEYIEQLATDNNGQVWGYTRNQLIKIDPENLSFTTYSFHYGLDEADFYHFSFLPSGEIIFGGRNDVIIANPFELKRNKEIPVPYIEQMQVLNQPFNFVSEQPALNLSYKQNFFSISFSALAFTMSKDVKFRYRLQGFDEWNTITGRGFANYTNVPGGNYLFQLQAANNEGIWNPKILELPVNISTPFWKTWWFRIVVFCLLVTGIFSLYRYRVRMVRKKQLLKWEYEKKLANVEMTALLAQMNPHFIFNSLNSIDSYIIRNESKQASEYLNNFARLMRLILQNSRSNYITLKDELIALELYLQMESLRFKNKFTYAISVDESLDTSAIVIPPMLIQPYIENAIWHGLMSKTNGEPGKVELDILKRHHNLVCIISDNGIGRKKAAELKEKKSTTHKRSMGMQITKDRIDIINKLYNLNTSVQVYDMENDHGEATGTRVELTIPI